MTDDAQPSLLDYLTKQYDSLKSRLTRKLGNPDLASDVLHDTWVRLTDKNEQRTMDSPGAYLMRVATNIAVDMERKQRRNVSGDDIDILLDEMADTGPDSTRRAEARLDLEAVSKVLDRMPERRRVILVMVHWQDIPQQEVAERLGVSRRTVEYELQKAHQRLHDYFDAKGK